MNLKYYLRGLGIGLIVTTIILAVSRSTGASAGSGTQSTVSEQSTSSSIIAYDRNQTTVAETTANATEAETQTEIATTQTEASTETATQPVTEASTESKTTEAVTEATTQATTQAATEAVTQTTTQAVAQNGSSNDSGSATIVIKDVYYGTQAADILYNAGLITDRDDFVQYLISSGYARTIHEGVYEVPYGSSYEQICKIICI